MYYIILIILIPLIYLIYTLEILITISYFLSIFLYYFNVRKDIIEYNLNIVFPNINKEELDKIRFNSYKYYLLNFFIFLNQYLFYDSFLLKYYKNKNLKIKKKSTILLFHLGIFYDFMSFIKQTEKSFFNIYKGKFNLPFNDKKIKLVKYKNVDLNEISSYHNIATSIDQKTSRGIEITFLNKKVKFHDTLLKYSIQKKRDLYLYYCIIDEKNYKINQKIIKINYEGKDIKNLIQEISDKMTFYIKKYPNQYLWLHNRFNLKK